MTIKHLVITGGGPTGLLAYGIASQLALKGFWQLADIQSIYGCSVGAYIGVVLSLGYAWDWLDDYFIKRPWEKLIATSTNRIIDICEKKCLINEHFFIEAIAPLLRAKDLKETITLKELYDYTNIEIHMYTANINSMRLEKVDLSYKSHPELQVIKALQMTMAVPVMFEPIFLADGCFIDGGILNNFPLNDCIEQQECDPDEILAFKNKWNYAQLDVDETSSIFYFLFVLLRKMQLTVDTEEQQQVIKHTVHCTLDTWASIDNWAETLKNEELRRSIITDGQAQADAFLQGLAEQAIDAVPDAGPDADADAVQSTRAMC
jgi:predicted acylesterase/phospholipase RssA